MNQTINTQSFKLLNENELHQINAGECVTDTIAQHPIKTALFGGLYILGVVLGCYAS